MKQITPTKIKFDSHGNNAPAYGCNEPGDNSGWYYQSTGVDELIGELEAELAKLKLCECSEGTRDCICCPEHKENWRYMKR